MLYREAVSEMLAAPAGRLKAWLDRVGNDNAQGEFYLTDVIALAVADGVTVIGEPALDLDEIAGINDRSQLAAAEGALRARRAHELMTEGAILADPARIDVRGEVRCGRDVFIDVGVVFEGEVAEVKDGGLALKFLLQDIQPTLPFAKAHRAGDEARAAGGPELRAAHAVADGVVAEFVEDGGLADTRRPDQ